MLKAHDVWTEPAKPVKIDVSQDRSRDFRDASYARSFPGERIVVHVPFEGEPDVFKLRTSTFSLNPPRGQVKANDLLLTIDYLRDQVP